MNRCDWRACLGLICVLISALLFPSATLAQNAPPPNPDDVDTAIKNGINYIESVEVNGSWDSIPQQRDSEQVKSSGYSALATYALLVAGVKPDDPHITAAVAHLEEIGPKMVGIYALGMRCQVWASLPPDPKLRAFISADADALIGAARHNSAPGLFRYTTTSKDWDMSAAQYGVLGLWGCAERSVEVPNQTWKSIEDAWLAKQFTDGAWGYQTQGNQDPGGGGGGGQFNQNSGSTTLTAAGIATLFVTDEYLHSDEGVGCKGNLDNAAIENAMAWLAPRALDLAYFPPYTLYAYERIGVAGGYKYFGTYNWYSEGAAVLLKMQQPDGSFFGGGGNPDIGPLGDTSLALLFLTRGRGPVILNKLKYTNIVKGIPDKDSRWDERPRDAANVTRWMGKELEEDVNWQLVTLDVPVEELHDAPILYIAGNQALNFPAAQENKLRLFVEEGGTIVGNADCANKAFLDGFKKLGSRLFPYYEFERLKPSSAVFKTPFPIREEREVYEQNNGIRPLMILLADDPARRWQTQAGTSHPSDFELLENILLYVQDAKHLMSKGESYVVAPDPARTATKHIPVARLQYAGNWNPEPGGWRRLSAILHNTRGFDLQIDLVNLGDGKLDNHYPLANLTGTAAFTLTESARTELKKYIDGGGIVIFDAGGGSGAFGDSFRTELAAMYPDAKLKLLPSAHPVLQSDGKPIQAEYRDAARRFIRGHSPRLQGVEINGRTAIFFSGEDFSSALVGQPISSIVGYDPATASLLMANIITYAGIPHPATVPASTSKPPASKP